MIYMYSINANNGHDDAAVDFDVGTDIQHRPDPHPDALPQAESQLPFDVQQYGVTIKKSTTSPLALFSLYSPNGTYDALFLANYAYININDPMTRVPGVGQVQIFGAGQYAMRIWVEPDTLAKLGITVTEILDALQAAEHREPGRPDRRRAGAARARSSPTPCARRAACIDRGAVRRRSSCARTPTARSCACSDVARIELGAQTLQP